MHDCAAPQTTRLEQMFQNQAAATPDAPAIHYRGSLITYGELAGWVDGMSRRLLESGVGPGVLVAVATERRPATIALLLAILRTGGAYLPLDQRYPPERTQWVLADSRAGLLVGERGAVAPAGFRGPVLDLHEDDLAPRASGAAPEPNLPADLAYVIYTSGSTGAPKGVMLGHGATHLIEWARAFYPRRDRARVAATTSLCFDPSIFEIFMPLCTGGALVLKQSALEPFTKGEQPTMLDAAPCVLAELCRAGAIPPSLRVINIGGDALSRALVRAAVRVRPDLRLYNHYGPTETTTCATVAPIDTGATGEPAIGAPVAGARIVLLAPDGEPAGEGATGEIHIGGPGLALGYLGRPDLTAARFVAGSHGRLYRTGDLGFWRAGELHFAGRTDRQVKVRGFRIELAEIEAALMRLPTAEAAIAAVHTGSGGNQLAGYIQSPGPLTAAQARRALAAWLPDYMVPAHLLVLGAFPLSPSGKVDQKALAKAADTPAPAASTALSAAEKAIIHVFEEVLGRGGVGPHDSFFDLGGDSLSCVRAALRLGEVLGFETPSALIPQAPTPRSLAAALDHGRVRSDGHISLLHAGGAGTPLFCAADLFGHAFNYLGLATELGAQRPIYGLSPGPLQERFTRDGDMDFLAKSLVRQVRRTWPAGPYLIAGYSAGGLLAAELAARLEAEGEFVRLVLLDAVLYSRRPPLGGLVHWLSRQGRGALLEGGRARPRHSVSSLRTLMRHLGLGGERPPDWIPRSQMAFAARMIRTGLRRRPPPFAGPVLLIKAIDRDPIDGLFDNDGLLGWSEVLKGDVVDLTVAGDHHQFLRQPLVGETAAAIRRFLADLD